MRASDSQTVAPAKERRKQGTASLPGRYIPDALDMQLGTVGGDGKVHCTNAEMVALVKHHAARTGAAPEVVARAKRPANSVRAKRLIVAAPGTYTDLTDPCHVSPDGRWKLDVTRLDLSEWTWWSADAGRYLGWPERTVRDLCRFGLIPAFLSTRYWRLHPPTMRRLAETGWGWVPWDATREIGVHEAGIHRGPKQVTHLRTPFGVTLSFSRVAVEALGPP